MAALQCEICGGKLIGKPGGIFECEYCGMEYSTEWAKAKIQEIKGTVKVEGTVEVTGKVQVEGGTVQVEGAANKESLLKRGFMALEDGKWQDADGFFDRVLDIDPENAEAYLGKLMAELQVSKKESLKNCTEPFDGRNSYRKAVRFGDTTLKEKLDSDNRAIRERNEEAARKAEEEKNREHKVFLLINDQINELTRSRLGNRISAGDNHTVGLRADGTVVAVGYNSHGQCKVSGWTSIVAVSAGGWRTVGLRADGTVVAVGMDGYGRCDVSDWTDIVEVSAGQNYTAGLRADGTVVAVGNNDHGKCNVSDWTDIVAISARDNHTVGLRADGMVVAVGLNDAGQCNVSDWTDIAAVSAGGFHTVGLRADGSVVVAGENWNGRCDVSNWKNIVAVSAGDKYTVGLRADGTVVAVGLENWDGRCNVSDWQLFNGIKDLEEIQRREEETERQVEEVRRKAGEVRRKAEVKQQAKTKALREEEFALNTELANLKGLFIGKRYKEIVVRLAEINDELQKLNG